MSQWSDTELLGFIVDVDAGNLTIDEAVDKILAGKPEEEKRDD